MIAYRLETVILPNGELQLKKLPFRPGEAVEVIVLPLSPQMAEENYPLANTVLKYENPTEPVAENDWDVLQ
ncbi:MAG: hypothetical protein KF770_12945 [Anaerolineae bacterium]|nr:hypothetical protein [Anaerolineae bacterium]